MYLCNPAHVGNIPHVRDHGIIKLKIKLFTIYKRYNAVGEGNFDEILGL